MRKSFPNPLRKTKPMINLSDQIEHLNCLFEEQHSISRNEVCAPIQPYLISAGCLLSCLQALIHMNDTNFGSSLGGKPIPLHKIHDHHMVFQLCTKRFDLKSRVDDCVRVAGHIPFLMSFCRNSRLLHDTRNLVSQRVSLVNTIFFVSSRYQVQQEALGKYLSSDPSQSFPVPDCVVCKPQP